MRIHGKTKMTKIYISEKNGSIYYIENGNLCVAPMPTLDAVIDFSEDGCVVDWDFVKEEEGQSGVEYLQRIESRLK